MSAARDMLAELRTPLASLMWLLVAGVLLMVVWDDASGWRPQPTTTRMHVSFIETPDGVARTSSTPGGDQIVADHVVSVGLRRHEPVGPIVPLTLRDRVFVDGPHSPWLRATVAPSVAQDLRARSLHHATEVNWQGLGEMSIPPDGVVARRILWRGVASLALLLVAGAGFLYSLRWTWRLAGGVWRHATGWRNRRATRLGRCPCGYTVTGLARCPECGRLVPSRT